MRATHQQVGARPERILRTQTAQEAQRKDKDGAQTFECKLSALHSCA